VNNVSKAKNLKSDLQNDLYSNIKLGNIKPVDSRLQEQSENVPSKSANAAYAAAYGQASGKNNFRIF
jgi:hypothetical protein